MTVYAAPICLGCTHFRTRTEPTREQFRTGEPPVTGTCDAFPDAGADGTGGIPLDIWRSSADHRHKITGDHGIRFEPRGERDAAYADLLFSTPDKGEDETEEDASHRVGLRGP